MKIRRYIMSFPHLEMLLRGEHHFRMKTGIPADAKIISFKNWQEGKPFIDLLMQSEEFEEVDNIQECRNYGSLALEGLKCMPLEAEKVEIEGRGGSQEVGD